MKKLFVVFLTLALLLLSSCENANDNFGTVKVYVGSENVCYTVDLSKVEIKNGLFSVIEYLSEEENLALNYSVSAFSYYVTEFGSLKEGDGNYIYFYTSISSDFDVSSYKREVAIFGQTLVSSRVGVQDMKVENNAVYFVGLVNYGA